MADYYPEKGRLMKNLIYDRHQTQIQKHYFHSYLFAPDHGNQDKHHAPNLLILRFFFSPFKNTKIEAVGGKKSRSTIFFSFSFTFLTHSLPSIFFRLSNYSSFKQIVFTSRMFHKFPKNSNKLFFLKKLSFTKGLISLPRIVQYTNEHVKMEWNIWSHWSIVWSRDLFTPFIHSPLALKVL